MRSKIMLYAFISILFYVTFFSLNTGDIVVSQDNSFTQDSESLNQELIYLQTNKGIYETGEDLWFKAYILDAQYFTPSGLSQTVYLQLSNENTKQVFWQEKYEIKNRFVNGHVYLQDTLSEGIYVLAAFTPHSYFNDSLEFESFRKISVKRNMKPRVTIKADFNQKSFTYGDSIKLIVETLSERSQPLYAEIFAELKKDNEILQTINTITDNSGKADLSFYPEYSSPGLTITIRAKHTDAVDEMNLHVPFHEGEPVQFELFPEGGYLVTGVKNRVAFKTVDVKGEPVKTVGTLFENSDTLLHFESSHAGMGSFEFVPDKNQKYTIRLQKPRSDSDWQLPGIKAKGVILHLAKRDSNFLYFQVRQSPGAKETVVCLRGQLRGNVYFFQSGVLKDELEIVVPVKDFPGQGIAEFTLLDDNMLPIAERLVYVNPNYKLFIKATLDNEKYSTREKATLRMKVTDKYGQPVVAHLGVSVFDKIYQIPNETKNIFTHFYLSSQLKGRIYDPAYYFDNKNNNRLEALDLLLLTQGWRRYVWNRSGLEAPETPVIFNGIKGKIKATKKERKAPTGNQVITIYNPAVNDDKYILLADSTGNIEISPAYLKLGQGGHVYLKPLGAEEYGYSITLNSPFDLIERKLKQKDFVYPARNTQTRQKEGTREFVPGPNVIQLDEIEIKGKQNYQFRDKYLGYLDSLTKVHLDPGDYVGPCGVLNCPVHEGNYRNTKPVEGEIYEQYVGFAWSGPDKKRFSHKGMINVEYHYPKFTEEFLLKRFNLTRVKGYYVEREFYQPQYDKTDSLEMIADYRNTLVWAPNVLTNRNGEATIEFFCSDIYTAFQGIIEGVSGDGRLGHKEFEFKVLKTELFEWEK